MSHKTFRCTVTGVLAILLLSWAGLAQRSLAQESSGEAQQEITRLAQLTHWKPGTVVADIGAGDGTYSFAAAEKVGPNGRVYATEIDPDKLKTLKVDAAKHRPQNVIVVEGAPNDTKLPSDCCDTIFLRHVYHHITQPQEFDKNLVRSLKPGAYLAIIDFPPNPNYPSVEGVPKNRGGHGIPQKIMVEELTGAGLQLEKAVNKWSGSDYCVIFKRPN
jgi:SAM-dependent methyltransferase